MKSKVGTSYYIAPEVLLGEYNEKCDVWSLGAITYIMLSGEPPFNGNSNHEIFNKIIKGGTFTFRSSETHLRFVHFYIAQKLLNYYFFK